MHLSLGFACKFASGLLAMYPPFPLAAVSVINFHLQAGVFVVFPLFVRTKFGTLRMMAF